MEIAQLAVRDGQLHNTRLCLINSNAQSKIEAI